MEASSSRSKTNGSSFHHHFQRSTSPSGRFCSYSLSSSTSPSFSSSDFMTRSTSPTRVNLRRSVSPSPNVRFSTSVNRSISHQQKQNSRPLPSKQKKTCMCSPTTHPGSFRCSLHKNMNQNNNQSHSNSSSYRSSYQLNMRRSAMTNSLVRIGTVEGDLVKRALAALIRPSSHHLRRRDDFQPRPSRLSVMSKAEDL
ncbi:probable protein ABIL3 [Lycium ferocissimum]|uniref:probable protein ABIL3 n=1 Tax=Lycium ferocissimum TaxID=112874 RepID=UPI0028161BF7|nr:probable protein ABIL3 [Lycium ferocissimum]